MSPPPPRSKEMKISFVAVFVYLVSAAHAAGLLRRDRLSIRSDAGRVLLERAQEITPHQQWYQTRRRINQQNYEYWETQYVYDNQNALYNLPDLYIQYTGCSSFLTPDRGDDQENQQNDNQQAQYNDEQQQNNGNRRRLEDKNQGDYYQQQQQQQQEQQEAQNAAYNDGMYRINMVRFTLCSSEDCGDCSGEYAVDMFDFLNTYTEMTMEENQYKCEYVRERCFCNNYGQDCLSSCYASAGLDGCMTEYYGGVAFQLQEYLECKDANDGGNNNNGYGYYNFYIGPYCHHTADIYLGAYYDNECSYRIDPTDFSGQMYGDAFPYMETPLLATGDCLGSCSNTRNDLQNVYNGYNQRYEYYKQQAANYGSNELCQQATKNSIKCDVDRYIFTGCNFLQDTLPCLDERNCGENNWNDDDWEDPVQDTLTINLERLMEKMEKYKKIAISMGAIAGTLLLLCCLCMCCSCSSSARVEETDEIEYYRDYHVGKLRNRTPMHRRTPDEVRLAM